VVVLLEELTHNNPHCNSEFSTTGLVSETCIPLQVTECYTAVAYIETLIEEKYGCGTRSCGTRGHMSSSSNLLSKDSYQSLWNVDNIKITPAVFKHMS
jgi:hypothetical protein